MRKREVVSYDECKRENLHYKKHKSSLKNNSIYFHKREKNYLDNLRHGYYSDEER